MLIILNRSGGTYLCKHVHVERFFDLSNSLQNTCIGNAVTHTNACQAVDFREGLQDDDGITFLD
ncbi:hypothetical protein D3C84_960440 [compost metagenome]